MSSPLQTLVAKHDVDCNGVLDKAEWTAFVLDLLSPDSPLTGCLFAQRYLLG